MLIGMRALKVSATGTGYEEPLPWWWTAAKWRKIFLLYTGKMLQKEFLALKYYNNNNFIKFKVTELRLAPKLHKKNVNVVK